MGFHPRRPRPVRQWLRRKRFLIALQAAVPAVTVGRRLLFLIPPHRPPQREGTSDNNAVVIAVAGKESGKHPRVATRSIVAEAHDLDTTTIISAILARMTVCGLRRFLFLPPIPSSLPFPASMC
jgi:hypothetical protein